MIVFEEYVVKHLHGILHIFITLGCIHRYCKLCFDVGCLESASVGGLQVIVPVTVLKQEWPIYSMTQVMCILFVTRPVNYFILPNIYL